MSAANCMNCNRPSQEHGLIRKSCPPVGMSSTTWCAPHGVAEYSAPSSPAGDFEVLGANLGRLTDEKKKQYGDSAERAGAIMAVLYPDGIPPAAFGNALLVVRICDKLCRIATQDTQGVDGGGEDAWRDIAGYGLIGSQVKR